MTEISSATGALHIHLRMIFRNRHLFASAGMQALADVAGADKSLGRARPAMLTWAKAPQGSTGSHPTMQKISAYILTYNEAEKIEAAVSSVLWADEVVVIDSFSVDRTAEIATSLGARVVEVPFNGFGELRNRAIEACKYDWLFSLDADERCTEEVRDEILGLMAGSPPHDVYLVPRRSYMMGRWIRGSGWYPNFRQPQLFRKGSMRYTLEPVHEGYEVLSGKPVGTLHERGLAIPVPQSGRGHQEDEPVFLARGAEARAQARLDGERARSRPVVVPQALHLQARLHRRLGRLRHRVRKFRRHVLSLRQALRRGARLAAAAEQADPARA